MAEKTKQPTGLTITRNKADYTCKWTIADNDYGDGQKFSYDFVQSTKEDWKAVSVTKKQTSVKMTLNHNKVWPKKGYKTVTAFKFAVKGNRAKYKKKDPGWSNWSYKDFNIKVPVAPSVGVERLSGDYSCKFTWQAVGSNDDHRPVTDIHWETILVKNSSPNYKDIERYFHSGTAGWQQSGSNDVNNYSAAVSGSITKDEVGLASINAETAYTRWFRAKARGPGGDSAWSYASHTYAVPKQAVINAKTLRATKLPNNTIEVYVEWTSDTKSGKNGQRPITQTVVSYAIAYPDATLNAPVAGTTYTDTSPVADTGGVDSKRFIIPSTTPVGKDQAIFVKVTNQYDGNSTESAVFRVTNYPLDLNAPIFSGSNPIVTDDTTYMVTVTASHTCNIAGSFIAVLYKTAKNQTERVIGVIGANETSAQIQLDNWTGEGAKKFGIRTVVGSWTQDSAYHRRMTSDKVHSATTWGGGDVPEAPQGVSYSLPNGLDGTIQMTWKWTWEQANAVELSWADHPDAWESTNGPTTYVVDSMKPNKWNISGLTVGQKWYVRVRLIKIDGESAIYGAYSDTITANLISAPDNPALTLTPDVIPKNETTVATWAYSSEDGTAQKSAEICEATIADDGTVIYGDIIAKVTDSSQRIVIDPSTISGWGSSSGETHHLCIRVSSVNGETSPSWSDPVTLTIAERPTTSITDIGENLVLETIKLNENVHQGNEVVFSHQECKPFITNVEMDISHQNEGEGIPTPTNIRHISGYNSVIVTKSNENDEVISTDTTMFPNDSVPVYEGHFNMTTGELVIAGHVIELDGTENWVKYGDYMCMDLTGYDYVKNDNLQSDRYVYADATNNGFYIGDINNFVDYGIVQTMFAE